MSDDEAKLIADIQTLEDRAYRLCLTITARALNHAKNAIGWELAGNIHAAALAANGDGRAIVR